MHNDILTTSQLGKTYTGREGEIEALKGLNLAVRQGEILGLLGPNGAGKTTAVKMIMGFMKPSQGTITFDGEQLAMNHTRERVGYLPERFLPNPNLTVGEYIRFHDRLSRPGQGSSPEQLQELLSQVGMAQFESRRISDLSKGMGQRLGLAQALCGNPDFLLLDEPTSGLDPIGRSAVIELMLKKQQQGSTIFFCSHILAEAERVCNRIGILVGGELRFLGTLEEFYQKWQTETLEQGFIREVTCAAS